MTALIGKVALIVGNGNPEQRAVAVALAESGADLAIGGSAGTEEVLLHSIANEIWAMGRRSLVAGLVGEDAATFATVAGKVRGELGRLDLVVRVEPVLAS